MTFDAAILNASIVVPKVGIVNTNIAIEGGRIKEFTPDDVQASRKINAEGLYVMPGAIDPHVHYGVFTPIDRAAETESRSAAVGGVTTMMRMFRLYGSYREKLKAHLDASSKSHIVDYSYHASVLTPEHVDEIDYCIENGITSFKLYMNLRDEIGTIYMDMEPYSGEMVSGRVNTDDALIQSTVGAVAARNGLLIAHAEDPETCAREIARMKSEGRKDLAAWSEARPGRSEYESIAKISGWVRERRGVLYLPHIGSSAAIDSILNERKNGTKIHVETCPHYLTHSTDFGNIAAKVVPPIRSKEDVRRMWQAVRDGTVNCIGTDHVANRMDMKKGDDDIWSALSGFPGMATMLAVLLSEGVNKGKLSIEKVAELCSFNTAQIFGVFPRKGTLAIDSDADLVLVNLKKEQKVTPELLQSYSDYTIYDGMVLRGWPVLTMVRGEVVMADGQVTGRPGHGEYVSRKPKTR